MLAAVAVAAVLAMLAGRWVGGDTWAPFAQFADLDGPAVFPPGVITVAVAALAVASPHVGRPFRHLGRWLEAGQFLGAVLLGAATIGGAAAAVWIGLLGAALVHILAGSPGGRPTAARIADALRELGVDVVELAPATMQASGVVQFDGTDGAGPLHVKVYGRDAWDAQLMANLWRLAWYRGSRGTARFSRVQLVEHEGFMTLLAERAGARVPTLVTAGSAGRGDALVVTRRAGDLARGHDGELTDGSLDALWHDLRTLHDAGITHGRLDLDQTVVRTDGTLGIGDLAWSAVAETNADRRLDDAQALGLTVALVGEPRATAGLRRNRSDAEVLAMLPFLQAAALPPLVRDALDEADVDPDDVRNHIRADLGAGEQELVRLRRVTTRSIVSIGLLGIATYTLIAAFGDIDLADFVEDLRNADWWWLALALLLAQLPRVPAAVSTMGSIERPLPLGPLITKEFAICYVNLAIPSTAARVAVNVRFFERFGVTPTTAMTAGAIDSVSGFVVQILIFVSLFWASDVDLGLSLGGSDTSSAATIALIVIGVIVVAAAVVLLVGKIRRRVVSVYHQAAGALRVLRNPRRVAQLFGGNVVSQVLFAIAFGACALAFQTSLSLSELLLINTVVSLFAGLLPIPGGIGVTEAGLMYGLTAAGVPSETAFAIAIAYRICSFYLPPVWGWGCYHWLVERRYL